MQSFHAAKWISLCATYCATVNTTICSALQRTQSTAHWSSIRTALIDAVGSTVYLTHNSALGRALQPAHRVAVKSALEHSDLATIRTTKHTTFSAAKFETVRAANIQPVESAEWLSDGSALSEPHCEPRPASDFTTLDLADGAALGET